MKHKTKDKKGVVFCIHANSSSSELFRDFVESDETSFIKIAIDLPGHGLNQKDNYDLKDFSFSSLKKYLLNEISRYDDEIFLVGNSLGGHLAIEIAPKVKNLKGLLITGAPPVKKPLNIQEALMPVSVLNSFFEENVNEEEIEEISKKIVVNSSKHPIVKNDFRKTNPLVRKAIGLDIAEGNLADEFDVFTNLNVPKYIVIGNQDITINKEYLNLVAKESGQCKVINFPNCGHYPSLDVSQKFTDLINEIAFKVF